jgi:hypothetical protein
MKLVPRSSLVTDRLRVVDAETLAPHRPVVARDELDGRPEPLFLSFGKVDLICGARSFVLVAGAPSSTSLRDAVLVCPACAAPHETWEAHGQHTTSPAIIPVSPGVHDAP